jgi:hypothetical protein
MWASKGIAKDKQKPMPKQPRLGGYHAAIELQPSKSLECQKNLIL